jgi:hypothetical protein
MSLVMIFSLASKCQDFNVEMSFFSATLCNEIEDIITKFKSQVLYTIKIKY